MNYLIRYFFSFLVISWEIINLFVCASSEQNRYLYTTAIVWLATLPVLLYTLLKIEDTIDKNLRLCIIVFSFTSLATISLCIPINEEKKLLLIWEYIHLCISFIIIISVIIYILYKIITKQLDPKYRKLNNEEKIIPIDLNKLSLINNEYV